jgi:hypothetical protein
MTKLLRLSIVLSCIWFLFAFAWVYRWDSREAQEIAQFYYTSCNERLDLYPNSVRIELACTDERDKVLSEWEKHKFSQPFITALIPLCIFWILGFIFIKTIKWIRNGK